jgi:hypothetical protein
VHHFGSPTCQRGVLAHVSCVQIYRRRCSRDESAGEPLDSILPSLCLSPASGDCAPLLSRRPPPKLAAERPGTRGSSRPKAINMPFHLLCLGLGQSLLLLGVFLTARRQRSTTLRDESAGELRHSILPPLCLSSSSGVCGPLLPRRPQPQPAPQNQRSRSPSAARA